MRVPFIFARGAFVVLIACFSRYSAAHAECLSSADAVWAAHPGSHATWRLRLPGHEGVKCWFVRNGGTATEAYTARGSVRELDLVNAIPLPLPRPDFRDAQAVAERVSLPTVPTGELRSILIWGTPMQIDPTWDGIFVAREFHAKPPQ
jgi:hypothetical protein